MYVYPPSNYCRYYFEVSSNALRGWVGKRKFVVHAEIAITCMKATVKHDVLYEWFPIGGRLGDGGGIILNRGYCAIWIYSISVIALSTLMHSVASLGLDACYSFSPEGCNPLAYRWS